MEFETLTTEITILPKGEALYSERATIVRVEDEAGGPFVEIRQEHDNSKPGTIRFDETEWPLIREAVERLLSVCEHLESGQ